MTSKKNAINKISITIYAKTISNGIQRLTWSTKRLSETTKSKKNEILSI